MQLNDKIAFLCRICGFELTDKPWGNDLLTPSFDICPCCGVEFGYEDCQLSSIRKYRANWQHTGSKWFEPKLKPANWSLIDQLKNILEEFI